ncbi:MAG: glutamine-hydrolyzing GMP synthase [Thermodesulfobacteriota bacterium]
MILIIDFGSQFNQLIARRVRESRVYCRIEPPTIDIKEIRELNPEGIILSGGPAGIYEKGSPKVTRKIFDLGIPVLGICYGLHFMADALGGKVAATGKREYGFAELCVSSACVVLDGVSKKTVCWMSHGDSVKKLPPGFAVIASTENTNAAVIADTSRNFYGLQFHPEVVHTREGKRMLDNFLFDICHCKKTWSMKTFAREAIEEIRTVTAGKKVLLGLSGGVDSSVTALLIHRAIGDNLTCIFVDNGLLRKNEAEKLKAVFTRNLNLRIRYVQAGPRFLKALAGVADPERKRKIIGKLFVDVFNEEAGKVRDAKFLAQGTLYPDVIESRSAFGGPSAVIKSHHNVGGLPARMKLSLVEPLRFLFKDEVRALGRTLGLDEDMIHRQPFPGPGLAIRVIGPVDRKKLDLLREVDAVLLEEIRKGGYYRKLWQSFAVLLPLKSVGIMGDKRTYEHVAAIRAVTSRDAMTADWARLPHKLLGRISNRIINEVAGVNRVVYDISSKPPSTIEWE